MVNVPQYVLGKNRLPQLKIAMQEVLLNVEEDGPVKSSVEGIEQNWMCSDQTGGVFAFATCELGGKNPHALEAGTVLLVVGPPTQKRNRSEVAEVMKRFEQALHALGAHRRFE